MKRRWIATLAAATLGAAALASAQASEDERDGALLSQAKIGIAQAIAAAEQHAKGRALRAELENENGVAVYGVEVLDGAKAMDVKVDARDGKVLGMQEERAGHAEEHEHDDGD